jgi:LPS export ABC transporter protein LptC
MSSTLMEQYENTDPKYSEFRNGINIVFYDGHKEPVASVTSKYARYLQNENIWELKDSVVVINEKNEMLETELLNWNQEKDLIYTDRYVKITSEDQIIHGFGFESDSHLRKQKIKKVQATIYFNDEE